MPKYLEIRTTLKMRELVESIRQFYLTEVGNLDPNKIEAQGILNKAKVANLLNPFLAGKTVDFNQIWLLLMFQMWYEKWME